MMRKILLGLVLLLTIVLSANAQKATLQGIVIDEKTGETMVGAQVVLEGTTMGAMTDFDGNYVIKNITPGTYTILCKFISYDTGKIENVTLNAGDDKKFDFKLGEATIDVGEVNVVAKVNRESESMMILEQRDAEGIKESIGAKQLSNMGVSDAAAATTKISGVTKTEGSGDVYIRGLGDRYLSTTMNNLPIPSDDVSKKNINLGLFSTDIISNVGINKTYDVSTYADQASGNVNVVSKTVGEGITIGLSAGVNTSVLSDDKFGNFRATQNKNDIFFGFYKQPYETVDAVQQQSWNTTERSLPIAYGFSFLGGNEFKLSNGKSLSFFATASHSGDSEYRTGVYRRYESNHYDREFTDAENYISDIQTTGLLNVTFNLSKSSHVAYNAFYINKTEDELYEAGRNGIGYYFERTGSSDGDNSVFIRDQNTTSTQVFINQLSGLHELSEKNKIEWGVAYNMVDADEPNRIRNAVSIPDDVVNYIRVGGYDQRKSSQKIYDNDFAGYIKDELKFVDEEDKKVKLDVGLNARYKHRDFSSKFVGVLVASSIKGTDIDNLDEVLNNESYYNSGDLTIREQTENVYDARLVALGGYANFLYTNNNFTGILGLRYEYDNLYIDYDVTNRQPGERNRNFNNILPDFSLKYQVFEKSALRLAASKTVTLPEFKEVAPFEYVSPEGDVIRGDTAVTMSNVYNFDFKWELFPGRGELLSVAGFYKAIKDPINMTLSKGSSQVLYYANTGERANVYGIEFEGKMNLIRSTSAKQKLYLSVNATKMWFKQDILEKLQYNNKTEIGLEGAAGFIANASLSYSTISENPFTATITGNYSSDKIYALGGSEDTAQSDVLFNNEIIEKGFTTLDVVLSKKISKKIAIKLSAKNLLNPSIERTQLIELSDNDPFDAVVRSYKKGINLNLGVNIILN